MFNLTLQLNLSYIGKKYTTDIHGSKHALQINVESTVQYLRQQTIATWAKVFRPMFLLLH